MKVGRVEGVMTPSGSQPAAAARIGRRERRKIATRAQLVRAGRKLFSERGLYEASIEDLADQAGIAKGTVYLYFGSKVELVQAVVEAGFEELERQVIAAVRGQRTLAGIVGRIVEAHVEFFAANPDLMRVFHQVRGILKFHRAQWLPLRVPLGRHILHIARLLARVPSPVRNRGAQRRAIALILFGAVSGACSVRAALESGPVDGRWSPLLRDGLAALASELAQSGSGDRGGRRRGGRA